MKVCRIQMLGGLTVQVGEYTIERFRSHKASALLSYLALNLSRHHARELLLELFWPEMKPQAARDNLSTMLSLLRRQLQTPDVPADRLLLTDYQNIRLNPETVATDVDEFEQLLKAATRAEEAEVRRSLLERAIGLYRGDLLPTCYEEWAIQEQARLKTRYGDALQQWTAALAQAGDLEAALIAAQRARQADPFREETYQAQIWLNAVLGRPALALETYRELEQFFRSELGISPSTATRALAERLRRAPGRFAARKSGAWCAEPSALWLHEESGGGDEEEERRQGKGGWERLPQQQTPPTERHLVRLPPQFTPFFGREEERSRLREMLAPQREEAEAYHHSVPAFPRLITVTGPGGVGKTRLSIEVAAQMGEDFAGRVWFVPLAEVPAPSLLPFALTRALNLSSTRDSNPLDLVVERLEGTDCLLILDNFEHLLREAHSVLKGDHPHKGSGTAYIRQLLERIPGLRCLVTSRQPLHLSGEQEFPIGPLPTPSTETQSPAQLMTCSSVALYWDRARAVKPDFAVTAQNADAVAGLCRKLEGLPLAIEMTAAWTRTLPPARLLERLEHQLDLLISRRSDLPSRHQSLRATIEWSYGLLSPELQTVFTCLSVFRNGWTLEAAEAILDSGLPMSDSSEPPAPSPTVLEALAQLQERSLLVAEEQGDEVRYRLLTSLREFAVERLAERGTDAWMHARHADYFLDLVEKTAPKFFGPERPAAYRLFTAEHDNIVTALAWCSAREADLEKAFSLATATIFFWVARGYWHERRVWLEGLSSRNASRTEARARVLLGASTLARDEEDYERAQMRVEEALEILLEVDCRQGVADALLERGAIAVAREDYAAAQAQYDQCLTILSALNDRKRLTHLYYYFGELAYKQGDLATARQMWERCCAIDQELGIIGGGGLWMLGRLLTELRDFAEARHVLRRHLLERCETGSLSGTMSSLEEHALLAAAQGQGERAGRLWGAASAIRNALGGRVADSRAEIKEYEERTERLRTTLGAEAFEAAFTAGYALTREQAIAYALEAPAGLSRLPGR
jgi:predicted ATPase/DNA-binding SARP family transcriptional activator